VIVAGPVFEGFPSGRVVATAIPNVFFTEVLPEIESLAELKLTLHVLWRISLKRSADRYVSIGDLKSDSTLMKSLGHAKAQSLQAFDDGIASAVARRTLLRASVKAAAGTMEIVVANSESGRAVLTQLQREGAIVEEAAPVPMAEMPPRPNIFELYEQNVGLLTPIIAEELTAATEEYPAAWIDDAFRAAVASNRRSWRYIRAILERWAVEGKDDGQTIARRAAASGSGKPGKWEQTYQPARRDVSHLR
jgi:DNA replication protein